MPAILNYVRHFEFCPNLKLSEICNFESYAILISVFHFLIYSPFLNLFAITKHVRHLKRVLCICYYFCNFESSCPVFANIKILICLLTCLPFWIMSNILKSVRHFELNPTCPTFSNMSTDVWFDRKL